MAKVVLDASALLAMFLGEAGGEAVKVVLADSSISAVNLAEVAARLVDKGLDDAPMLALLAELPCQVDDFGPAEARGVALMRRATRSAGLSLGDRACLELASRHSAPAYTADRAWAELDLGVEVVLIR